MQHESNIKCTISKQSMHIYSWLLSRFLQILGEKLEENLNKNEIISEISRGDFTKRKLMRKYDQLVMT